MNALQQLESVLCDPEGKCCIAGSHWDRATVDEALAVLRAPIAVSNDEIDGIWESIRGKRTIQTYDDPRKFARALLAYVNPQLATTAQAEPVAWTAGPNEFKDWCSQYFGPDSDDSHLAEAVFNLPPMAQKFKRFIQPPSATVVGGDADRLNPYPEGSSREAWRRGFNGETNFGAKGSDFDRQYQEGKRAASKAKPADVPMGAVDPLDTPLPCDITVGHGTMRKGVPLRSLVLRMKSLYEMATGNNADEVANRTPEERQALWDKSPLNFQVGGRFVPELTPEAQTLSAQLGLGPKPAPALSGVTDAPMQGLAAYLRCEAIGVYFAQTHHATLLQWALEVDAASRALPGALPAMQQALAVLEANGANFGKQAQDALRSAIAATQSGVKG